MGLNAYRQEKVGREMTAPAILTEETLGLLSLGRNLFREPFDPHLKQNNLRSRGQAGKAPMREARFFPYAPTPPLCIPSRHQPPWAATCHPKRCLRSKGNRRPEWMLRAYVPS